MTNPKDKVGATKPNLSVLPFAPLLETVAALYEGRRKYGPFNWRGEKVSETIYADAAIRHLMQFIAGEDLDPDSGVPHVTKAIAGLLILRDAQMHGCSTDDRLVDQNLNIEEVMEQMAAVREKYPEQAESNLPPRAANSGTIDAGDADAYYDTLGQARAETTVAGGGSYVITPSDVGNRVRLRNGRECVIEEWDGHATWPVCLADQPTTADATPEGYRSHLAKHGTPPEDSEDIVAVYLDQHEPTVTMSDKGLDGSTRLLSKYSDTVAGGGSYLIKEGDVGKTAELRKGVKTTILAYGDRSYGWDKAYPVIFNDPDGDNDCCTRTGFSSYAAESEDQEDLPRMPNDIVRVFHA